MGSFSEDLAIQARSLVDHLKAGWDLQPEPLGDGGSKELVWTLEESCRLLSHTGENWHQNASLDLDRDAEACVRKFEALLMKMRPAQHRHRDKKWMSNRLPPRLTERQQLALLLHQTKPDLEETQLEEDPRDGLPEDFDQWPAAKQTLWQNLDTAPDKFYHDHTPPGVSPKTEAWTPEEEELFLLKLRLHPPMGLWGLFSLHIPGRTGVQCEQMYRTLEAEGRIDKRIQLAGWAPDITPARFRKTAMFEAKSPTGAKRKRLSSSPSLMSPEHRGLITPNHPPHPSTPNAPKESRQPKMRSKGYSMAPVTLMLEGCMSPKKPSRLDEKPTIQVEKFPSLTELSPGETDSPTEEGLEEMEWPAVYFAQKGPPSIPPFSSAGLPPFSSPPDFSAELEDELSVIARANEFRQARLRDSFARQLDQLRVGSEESSTGFCMTDACKWLRKSNHDRDESFSSIFELPWTREQRSRRCMEEFHAAQKDADRIHQFQVQALEALQQQNLS